MFDKLQGIEDKLEKINSSLCDPEVVSNQEEYKKLMREAKTLTPIVEKFREYKKANSDLTEAKEMLADSSLDKEFRDMASEEAAEAQKKTEELKEELKVLLLPKDPNDYKNVIVEIRGGEHRVHEGKFRWKPLVMLFLPARFSVCTVCMPSARAGKPK